MRLYEILREGYSEDIKQELMSSLLSLKANKGNEVPTNILVRKLNDLGYSCTVDSIIPLLSELQIVSSVDSSTIVLGDGEQEVDGMSKEQSDDAVMNRLSSKGIQQ